MFKQKAMVNQPKAQAQKPTLSVRIGMQAGQSPCMMCYAYLREQ